MENDEQTPELEQDENKNQKEEETKDETKDETSEQSDSSTEDKTDWKSEALKQKAINERLNKRLSKPNEIKSSKSDELDYNKLAFLTSKGFDTDNDKEMDFVKTELKTSKEELKDLLKNDYFKAKLEKFRALNKTADATIRGKDSKGISTDSVEYWAQKPIEEVPMDMRIKVVNYKLKKEQGSGVFYNQN